MASVFMPVSGSHKNQSVFYSLTQHVEKWQVFYYQLLEQNFGLLLLSGNVFKVLKKKESI